jgi:hypothetical protein
MRHMQHCDASNDCDISIDCERRAVRYLEIDVGEARPVAKCGRCIDR